MTVLPNGSRLRPANSGLKQILTTKKRRALRKNDLKRTLTRIDPSTNLRVFRALRGEKKSFGTIKSLECPGAIQFGGNDGGAAS